MQRRIPPLLIAAAFATIALTTIGIPAPMGRIEARTLLPGYPVKPKLLRTDFRGKLSDTLVDSALQDLLQSGALEKVLNNDELRLSSGILLRDFGSRLELSPIARTIALQGQKSTTDILRTVGVSRAVGDDLCQTSVPGPSLSVAEALLRISNNSDYEKYITSLGKSRAFTSYPLEVKGELIRATLRAFATECITRATL